MTDQPTNRVPQDWLAVIAWPKYFHDQQKQVANSKTWQTWYIGGNGSGKSILLYWSIVAYSLGIHPHQFAKPPIKTTIIVPSFDNVEEVAMDKLFGKQKVYHGNRCLANLGALLPQSMIKTPFSKEHRSIVLKNGSIISWVTTEQGWRFFRGREHDILAMDEEGGEREFDELLRGMRNAKNGGKILGALTPPYEEGKGPTWTREKVVEAAITDPDILVVRGCMADNPAITEEFRIRFSKGKSQEQIDVQLFGKYPSWGQLIHYPYQDEMWDVKAQRGHLLPATTPIPGENDVNWLMAFDWHQSKACAAIWAWIDKDGNIVIFDELDKDLAEHKEIVELVQIFRSIEGFPHIDRHWRRWQDPSAMAKYEAAMRGFNAWEEFRKHGIITAAGVNREPSIGISLVNQYLKGNTRTHPRLFIFETCKWTRNYLNSYYWKRTTEGAKPSQRWSDYPTCIRYIIEAMHKGPKKEKKWPLYSYGNMKEWEHNKQWGDHEKNT